MKQKHVLEKDLEILELLKERLHIDTFGRIYYEQKLTLKDNTYSDTDEKIIYRWLKQK